jgi:hypothetical protein
MEVVLTLGSCMPMAKVLNKIRTTFTNIQITRLLVKLYCFEIILFSTFAIGILLVLLGLLPAFVNADSVVNECNTGSECANFGDKYYIGEGVKQDDFKAVELNHTPFGKTLLL